MALSSSTIWEVQTGGSDTANGGAFDPSQTAGMFADGAATVANTSAPVFSSASYNFVAGDVGAWIIIASGTNWTPGWYQIASVASNAATLNGTIGQGVLKTLLSPTTVVGCATVASPTSATWSIDYSQQSTAQFTYTDLASTGAGLTVSSAAKPFAKQQVGNSIVITGGTNFTAGRYVIASVAAGVATVVGPSNITSGVGASGTGGQGGAAASPGLVAGVRVASNQVRIKAGTYAITTASTNVSGGCISDILGTGLVTWEGYQSVRGDLGTAPVLQASGISSATLMAFATAGAASTIRNLVLDGNSLTSMTGWSSTRSMQCYLVTVKNCTTASFSVNGSVLFVRCAAIGNGAGWSGAASYQCVGCVAASNTGPGFGGVPGVLVECLAYSNSGASSDGFQLGQASFFVSNCSAYANGRDGFRATASTVAAFINCAAEGNSAFGFNSAGATPSSWTLLNCAGYNNTSGNVGSNFSTQAQTIGFITGLSSLFTNAAGGDFSPAVGSPLRAAGYPGVFPLGLTTGYLDIGAAAHADPATRASTIIGGMIVRAA